ncbi:MAG: assimilatory sulfite reductase (NADPH) flavoprotein subunit [Akkermansiaceae bacterium]
MIEIPTFAPLDAAQKSHLSTLLSSVTSEQITWISGFLAGVQSSSGSSALAGSATAAAAPKKITVLYGTESGNAESLSNQLAKDAKKKGMKANVVNMSEAKIADLKSAEVLLVVVSTWGDGEPPETAEAFHNELMATSESLAGVEFSVCALGDTSYELFCETGKQVDAQLEKLGATRIVDRVDCDVDYDESFNTWSTAVFAKIGESTSVAAPAAFSPSVVSTVIFDKKNPFPAEVLDNQLLSGEHSQKETIHLEFDLEGSGLTYEPGDVLCVVPRNAADVVDALIKASGLSASDKVEIKDAGEKSLMDALTSDLDVTGLSRKIMTAWQAISGSDELAKLLAADAKEAFKAWVDGRQIVDMLESFPAKDLSAQQLVNILRKLPPRLYSIASSPKAHPGEVHLTVAAVRYDTNGKQRKGVASTFLADDAPKGSKVSVYIHQNKNFRLPENGETPVIMVGPGTGIAPFRAFVEERAETGAKGDSWLFFGDQCYNEDFLYQLEWQEHLKDGNLSRLDVAFSRDQPEKYYVQHKLLENSADIWQWLEKGAHFYVCGDASRMAKDVNDALIQIVSNEGGKSVEEAEVYLAALKKDKRYQRDVY